MKLYLLKCRCLLGVLCGVSREICFGQKLDKISVRYNSQRLFSLHSAMQRLKIKCCVVGNAASGKTCLIHNLVGADPLSNHPSHSAVSPRHRVDVYTLDIVQKECNTTVELWDVGQRAF